MFSRVPHSTGRPAAQLYAAGSEGKQEKAGGPGEPPLAPPLSPPWTLQLLPSGALTLPSCGALVSSHARGPARPAPALRRVVQQDMRVLYEDYEPVDLSIPYLPGYLGFRECDAYARLLQRVEGSPHRPQVLLVDGCGTLHPRGCGSACQVGITCDYPSVGVAKNLLAVDGLDRLIVRQQLQAAAAATVAAGEATASWSAGSGAGEKPAAAAAPPGSESRSSPSAAAAPSAAVCTTAACVAADAEAAATSDIRDGPAAAAAASAAAVRDVQVPLVGCSGVVHGTALCPGLTLKPLFISVGHRLSLATAVELVRRCCVHRVPEPIRQADLRSRQWLRNHAFTLAATTASKG
ncbi:hypothetical protein PLESTB_000729200 [Pleodorina starrii]|uniref:Endonuclease V n=1 Tax=Pleodorina starrii TaxID=330485 RepID=A0A9W6F1Z4_9CHLO|nr:hypothetical protein PLESTB_000729200 [Pleodorina starrii]